jgi:hypothetical protein
VCNPAFKALFDIDIMPMSQTFSQNIFRLYDQSNKQFSFFRLLEKFVKSGKEQAHSEVYQICAHQSSSPASYELP